MIIKELPTLFREKLGNSTFLLVTLLGAMASGLEAIGMMRGRNNLIIAARATYWRYVRERQQELSLAIPQWEGPGVFSFVVKRYTARDVSEIKTISLRASSMFEAQARLQSYNQGSGFTIISRNSNSYDSGVWAEITNVKAEFLATDAVRVPDLADETSSEIVSPQIARAADVVVEVVLAKTSPQDISRALNPATLADIISKVQHNAGIPSTIAPPPPIMEAGTVTLTTRHPQKELDDILVNAPKSVDSAPPFYSKRHPRPTALAPVDAPAPPALLSRKPRTRKNALLPSVAYDLPPKIP